MRFAYVLLSALAYLFLPATAFSQDAKTNYKAVATVAVARAKMVLQAPIPPQAPFLSSQLPKHAGISGKQTYLQPMAKATGCDCILGNRCVCGQTCPCGSAVAETGWVDLGNGYQRHSSGYLYSPAAGVYWPQENEQISRWSYQNGQWQHPQYGAFANGSTFQPVGSRYQYQMNGGTILSWRADVCPPSG